MSIMSAPKMQTLLKTRYSGTNNVYNVYNVCLFIVVYIYLFLCINMQKYNVLNRCKFFSKKYFKKKEKFLDIIDIIDIIIIYIYIHIYIYIIAVSPFKDVINKIL